MTISPALLETLEARGLDVELVDRLGFASERREGGDALVIPFKRDGQVVRRKFRWFDRTEKRWSQDQGGVKCAWNEDVLRDDKLLGQPLIITEGEFDAVAAIQAGYLRTISVPDGAPPPGERTAEDLAAGTKYSWIDEIKPFLTKDRAPEIIIASDGDPNGAALLQDLSILLGRYRCKFVVYPMSRRDRGRDRCKDLNEVLEDYGARGVTETLNRAQWIRVDGVYRMSELPPQPADVIYNPRGQLVPENIKIRLGDLSVWTGVPGFGKSTLLNDLFCGIAQDHGVTVAWASFEQDPQRDHRRNLKAWFNGGAELFDSGQAETADQWIDRQHVFIVPSEDDDATLDWLVEKMEIAVVRHGARLMIIDPWNEIEHCREPGETETEYTGRAIRTLKRFAKAFRVHVAIVAHPTKSTKDEKGVYRMPTLYDISGSANWYNKADLGIIVHRETEEDTILKVQKSRYHEVIGRPGTVKLDFVKSQRRFREVERVA